MLKLYYGPLHAAADTWHTLDHLGFSLSLPDALGLFAIYGICIPYCSWRICNDFLVPYPIPTCKECNKLFFLCKVPLLCPWTRTGNGQKTILCGLLKADALRGRQAALGSCVDTKNPPHPEVLLSMKGS